MSVHGSVTMRMGCACCISKSGDSVGYGGYSASTMKSCAYTIDSSAGVTAPHMANHGHKRKILPSEPGRTLTTKFPVLNPPAFTDPSSHWTSPSQSIVCASLFGSGRSAPSPIVQVRHARWPCTHTMICRSKKTRMKVWFLSLMVAELSCRGSFVLELSVRGPVVSACKDSNGARSWTWNGMASLMAYTCTAGMKSCIATVSLGCLSRLLDCTHMTLYRLKARLRTRLHLSNDLVPLFWGLLECRHEGQVTGQHGPMWARMRVVYKRHIKPAASQSASAF